LQILALSYTQRVRLKAATRLVNHNCFFTDCRKIRVNWERTSPLLGDKPHRHPLHSFILLVYHQLFTGDRPSCEAVFLVFIHDKVLGSRNLIAAVDNTPLDRSPAPVGSDQREFSYQDRERNETSLRHDEKSHYFIPPLEGGTCGWPACSISWDSLLKHP